MEREVFNTPSFKPCEVEDALEEFKRLPVFVEHDPEMEIGYIDRTYTNEDGWLLCDMFIDEKSKYGADAWEDVKRGNFMGVSTGFDITQMGRHGPVSFTLAYIATKKRKTDQGIYIGPHHRGQRDLHRRGGQDSGHPYYRVRRRRRRHLQPERLARVARRHQ